MDMEIISAYREDGALRRQLSDLASCTFGLDLEKWYASGYWGDEYTPWSIFTEGRLVANVSVSRMRFFREGGFVTLLQLGTVMTEPAYRGQGLIRRLMEAITTAYARQGEGYYLFANDSVLDFYPKFGFTKRNMYILEKEVDNTGKADRIKKVDMARSESWRWLEKRIGTSRYQGRFWMAGNAGHILFHIMNHLRDAIYALEKEEACVIARIEKDTLFLHGIFCTHPVETKDIIEAFGNKIRKVRLDFVPEEVEAYDVIPYREPGSTLFVKGPFFEEESKWQGIFPLVSQA